ncbi:CopM family metallochaperone [Enterobacter ludwigii]|nr:DUF305 domain-containing protein [Enterobacter ludwigii]MBX8911055.1 DUF305 domain-containing protein [Enterobacter ludwigii]
MTLKSSLLLLLVVTIPGIAAEHSSMSMPGDNLSPSSKAYMTGMKAMHNKMMDAVSDPDPDRAFAKGMTAHHEGAIAMAETELQYGKDPQMRKLAENIIKAQKGEIEQMNK